MGSEEKTILIIDPAGNHPAVDHSVLTDWTIHLVGDFEAALRELADRPTINVVMVPQDAAGQFRAFLKTCTRQYSGVSPLLITTSSSKGKAPPGIPKLSASVSPEGLQEALDGLIAERTPGQGNHSPIPSRHEILFQEDWVKVVAHDIRSPLTLINSYTSMLLRDGFKDEAQVRLIVERIRNSGQWMIALVDNILDLALLEEGRLGLKYTLTPLEDILSMACDNMRSLAENAQVTLEWGATGDSTPYRVDHLKIEQVLQNLIGNGIKHSEKGGRVLVRASAEEDSLLFSVRDWGRGMSLEETSGIFDRFTSTASSTQLGRGLGLTIANTIVKLHGGAFQLESGLGQGSIFSFTIVPGPDLKEAS